MGLAPSDWGAVQEEYRDKNKEFRCNTTPLGQLQYFPMLSSCLRRAYHGTYQVFSSFSWAYDLCRRTPRYR
jgi:hypothetical protein